MKIILIFAFLLSVSLAYATTQSNLEDRATIYYKLDDDAANTNVQNYANVSMNGTATANTDTLAISDPVFGTGFDNAGIQRINTNYLGEGCTNMSVFMTVVIDSKGGDTQHGRIVSNIQWDGTREGWHFALSGGIEFELYTYDSNTLYFNRSVPAPVLDTLYNFAFTFNNADNIQKAFLNGTETWTVGNTDLRFATTRTFYVFGDYVGTYNINGKVYEFGLWCDYVLTQTDIDFLGDNPDALFVAPTDTCTYVSGDWNVDCADNCIITSDIDILLNTLNLYGTGTFSIMADITAERLIKENTCQLITQINDGNALMIQAD